MSNKELRTWQGTSWRMLGKGPPVILVHGLGLNLQMWQWQLSSLSPHFSVICYDLLGHGNSMNPRLPCRMEQFTNQLLSLMEGLNLKKSTLVGFSLGGLIVQNFALSHPEKVVALVILNTAHSRNTAERDAILDRVQQASERGPASTVEDALQRWFTNDFALREPEVLEKVKKWILANDKEIYPEIYRLLAECDEPLTDVIRNICCPTLIMTGEEDFGNSPAMAKRMSELIPHAQVEILKGLKHMGLVENPQEYNSHLVKFLLNVLQLTSNQ